MRRRGVDFGFVLALRRDPLDRAAARYRWDASEAVFLPGIVASILPSVAGAIEASLQMFERLRKGRDFLDELERRLRDQHEFAYSGSTVEHLDPRDVETVFFDAATGTFAGAADLWARASWIANDESDRSLRIRHSSGDGAADGWMRATERTTLAVDALARSAFPECAAIDGCGELQGLLRTLLGRPYHLSERILYNNAPDGGAVFHHDAEPGQLGVCYTQLQGRTTWLTLSKRRLARLVVRLGLATNERAGLDRLDHDGDRQIWQLLNRDLGFAKHLSALGAVYVVEEGDSILLPSQGFDDCAWHSVIALGDRPSLAHSYGIFPLLGEDAATVAMAPASRRGPKVAP